MNVPVSIRLRHRVCVRVAKELARLAPGFAASQLRDPVFLIGCGRSGTTLLNNMLRLHRDIATWSEANEVLDPEWYPWRPSSARRPPLEFDPHEFTRDWWHSIPAGGDRIRSCFGAYQWIQHKRVFVNKSPFNTFRIPHLLELFPSSRFIYITRDGRAVVYSYARKITRQKKLAEWPEPQRTQFRESFDELLIWLSNFWKACHEEVCQQDADLHLTNRGVMMTLRYEELCAHPEVVLDQICQFLDIDAARFVRQAFTEVELRDSGWREALPPEVVERMIAAMQPALTELHYADAVGGHE
jgi:hypothetical protein